MSLMEPPPLKPGDDLDGLLRTFFRGQMPHPWPASPRPRLRAAPCRRSLARSRWVLAASIGLLLLGSLLLPGRLAPRDRAAGEPNGKILSDIQERRQMKREHDIKEFQEKHQPGAAVPDDDPLHDLDESDMPSIK